MNNKIRIDIDMRKFKNNMVVVETELWELYKIKVRLDLCLRPMF